MPYPSHARLPASLAELQSGWEIWLQFALEAGAINSEERVDLAQRCSKALAESGRLQTPNQTANNPVLRFVSLLQAALAAGRVHVANRHGGAPDEALLWGWNRQPSRQRWMPSGVCIGWVIGDDLYLDSSASYRVVRQWEGLERVAVSEQTLRHRLHKQGLLVSIDTARQSLLVRRTLGRCPRHVLHLNASDLLGDHPRERGS